jgi:O-antigen/teichoic acid export membrane protein
VSGARVARNSVWLLAAEGSRRLISLVVAIVVARALSVEDFGRFGLALALAGIFEAIAAFGLTPLLVREAAADSELGARSFQTALGLRLVLGAVASLAMILFGRAMGYEGAARQAVDLAATIVWGNALAQTGEAMFDGQQRMELAALATVLRSLVLLACVAVAVWAGWGLTGVVGAYLANAWFAALFNSWLAAARLPGVSLRPRLTDGLPMLRRALPFVLIGFVWIVAFRVDMVLLERLTDERSVGLYRSGYAFFELLLTLPVLTTRALYPALSAGIAESGERWSSLLAAALRVFWLIALPVSIGAVIVGGRFVPLFYGAKYAEAGRVVALLGGCLWIWFGTMTFVWALTAADRLRAVLIGNVSALAVNVAVNLALIPRVGYFGAAIATVASEAFLLLYFLAAMRRSRGGLPRGVFPWRAMPAALTLAACAWLLRDRNLALVTAAGAAAYLAVGWLGGAANERERELLVGLWRRKSA